MKMGHCLCEQARTFSVDGFAKHHRVKMNCLQSLFPAVWEFTKKNDFRI